MRRWIIVTLIFALAHIGCESAEQEMERRHAELRDAQEFGDYDLDTLIKMSADNNRQWLLRHFGTTFPAKHLSAAQKVAHFVDPGNLTITDGHGEAIILSDEGGETDPLRPEARLNVLDASNPQIRMGHSELSRQEQVTLMAECVEDAIAVCQDANIYPLSTWYRDGESDDMTILAPQIAVAFFNYRTGGDHVD